MSLHFNDTDGRNVNYGSNSSLDNLTTFTYVAWIYPTALDTAAGSGIITKGTGGAGSRRSLEHRSTSQTKALYGTVDLATTDAEAESNADQLVDNSWQFVVMTYDDTPKDVKLYYGTLTTIVAEVSYSGTITGSGATGDNSGQNQFVGAYGAGTIGAFEGKIAFAGIWNRVLTLGDMIEQQFDPKPTNGCVLFTHLGWNGTGTQPDWSGNANNGTITGAPTVDDHVSLGPAFGEVEGQAKVAVAASSSTWPGWQSASGWF